MDIKTIENRTCMKKLWFFFKDTTRWVLFIKLLHDNILQFSCWDLKENCSKWKYESMDIKNVDGVCMRKLQLHEDNEKIAISNTSIEHQTTNHIIYEVNKGPGNFLVFGTYKTKQTFSCFFANFVFLSQPSRFQSLVIWFLHSLVSLTKRWRIF